MSRKSNSTSTSSNQTYYDQRSVVDAGGGVVGNGNDSSSRFNYQAFTDRSDRSVDSSQRFTDWSNRSTNDSRDQRIDNRQITDGGAFDVVRDVADGVSRFGLAQIGLARDLATRADASSSSAMTLAMRAQQDAASFNEGAAGKAFDLARSSAAQAFASSGDAIGFTRDTFADVVGLARDVVGQAGDQARTAAGTAGAAYSSASDTSSGNKTLVYAGIAVVALVGVVVAFKSFKG